MTFRPIILAMMLFGAFSLAALAQDTIEWKNYTDSANDIRFQAPAAILIDNDSDSVRFPPFYKTISLRTYIDGAQVWVRKFKDQKKPTKYVEGLKLPWGEKGSKTQDYKLSGAYVRVEIEPVGSDTVINVHAAFENSYFRIIVTSANGNAAANRFLQTIRFAGSRLHPDIKIEDINVTGEPIVFDKLPASPEVDLALARKPIRKESDGEFGDVKSRLPIDRSGLSSDLVILRRPTPSYTDDARMRRVEGTIPVNVQFLASGDIGNIIVSKWADRGLAKNVISAARRIKFIPAKSAGKAVEVTRTLTYSFEIY